MSSEQESLSAVDDTQSSSLSLSANSNESSEGIFNQPSSADNDEVQGVEGASELTQMNDGTAQTSSSLA